MDHFILDESNFLPFNERNEKKYKCAIFGPTCDSKDKIIDEILLPDLEICSHNTSAVNFDSEFFLMVLIKQHQNIF